MKTLFTDRYTNVIADAYKEIINEQLATKAKSMKKKKETVKEVEPDKQTVKSMKGRVTKSLPDYGDFLLNKVREMLKKAITTIEKEATTSGKTSECELKTAILSFDKQLEDLALKLNKGHEASETPEEEAEEHEVEATPESEVIEPETELETEEPIDWNPSADDEDEDEDKDKPLKV